MPTPALKHLTRIAPRIVLLCVPALLTGCGMFPTPPSPGQWFSSLTGSSSSIDASALKDDPSRSPDDVIGPLQRQALSRSRDRSVAPGDAKDFAALKASEKYFDDGQYELAARGLSTIARKRKPGKFELFGDSGKNRPTYDPIREEAVFYLAESQFMLNRHADAVNNYELLIKDYPSTRFMDESTRRLFEISRQWLKVDDFATTEEIRQVSFEDGADDVPLSTEKAKSKFSLMPNFSDRSRPVFDQKGHAIKALKTIWLNDPSGPLADDALMLAATHYLRSEEYREADRLFTILREQFPKSTHLQSAFVLGSHVKLMSYQGAAYDEQLLADARQLKENSLRLFPDLPEADRVRRELKSIHEAEAKREWELAVFYEKKRKPKAVLISCREILAKYSDTSYADLARAKLAELGVGGVSAASQPSIVPMIPLQQVPANGGYKPAENDGPVYPGQAPIFDDDPVPPQSTGVGRTRL